ncbi:MAG: VWA domain-containing protein [Bacteroidota bacterium]
MSLPTVLLIALAAIFALGFVFFKYFLGNKKRSGNIFMLAGLRFISVFILLLLLINPKITQQFLEVEKPLLLIAVDQSASIEHIGKADSVQAYLNYLRTDTNLQEKFSIEAYGFGSEAERLGEDSLKFKDPQTNISRSLKTLGKLNRSKQAALVLITDGNQTVGEDFQYLKSHKNINILPVVVGDTAAPVDLYISNLNVNKYAFLNNRFPVEVVINYSGKQSISTKFDIRSGNTILFSKVVDFNSEDNSEIITTTLPATKLGSSFFTAKISPIDSEKNTLNNTRSFGVEVIDERTSVLILSSIAHPDLGMLKKSIESNEQREVKIDYIKNYNNLNLSDFQLIIVYQPNNQFNDVFETIKAEGLNNLLITGTETDWTFLNSVQQNFNKDPTSQTQEVFANFNQNFSEFQFEDLGFNRFPPLEDTFGILKFMDRSFSPLLFQIQEGVETDLPLLAVAENNSVKQGVLFGENIWKWRVQSYVDSGSFEAFDNFTGKLIQYLASTTKRDRLSFEVEPFYPENEQVRISAQFFDQNYVFDPTAELIIQLENSETGSKIETRMLQDGNRYKFEAEDLVPGDYTMKIMEQNTGISRAGSFSILEYKVEQQFSSANISKLQALAQNNESTLYYLDDATALKDYLLSQEAYVSIQKSHEKNVSLINWKFLLVLLVLSLGIEWFLRKYFGFI